MSVHHPPIPEITPKIESSRNDPFPATPQISSSDSSKDASIRQGEKNCMYDMLVFVLIIHIGEIRGLIHGRIPIPMYYAFLPLRKFF
eukprot:gene10310-11212_t